MNGNLMKILHFDKKQDALVKEWHEFWVDWMCLIKAVSGLGRKL